MKSDKKFLSDVDLIKKASETRRLVLFVGAGVSMNSGIPSWGSLINKLREDIGIDRVETEDPLQVAQIYFNEKKHKEYIDKVRDILYHKKTKYNSINEAIFDLSPEHIITTNYDDLLEQVIKKRALPFSIIKKDIEFPYAANSNLLVKMHGDLDNDDFILKEEDYLEYEEVHPLFESFIKSVFSTKTVLFIGYSYSDVNLKIILQKVKNILGNNYQSSYLLTHESYSDYKVNYLKARGVNVLSYAKNKEYIDAYLSGTNAKLIYHKRKDDHLSAIGKDLLALITFVVNFDRFKEDMSKYHYVDQMYSSLRRFSEMRALPYFFIANLYPFNNTSSIIFYNEHDLFSLNINNAELIEFLSKNVTYNNYKTYFKEEYLASLTDSVLSRTLQDNLYEVVKILNNSGINRIKLRVDRQTKDSDSSEVILFNNQSNFCNCLTCLLDNLKLDKLLNDIQILNITDESEIQSDSLLAFSHYKIGNIFLAYNLFEEIAQKAWQSGKYIVYFISKYNLKRLGHSMEWFEYKNIDKVLIDELRDKSNKIDLDSVYRQINDVSKEESELLKIIRDDEVLERASVYIDKEYEKITEVYNNLIKGGAHTMYDPAKIIDFHLMTVNLFYNRNYIVNDIFSEYLSVFNKGIEALLIDHITYQKFAQEQKSFDRDFCDYFLHYGNFDRLNKIIQKYKIDYVILDDEAKLHLSDNALNYLKSLIEKGSFGQDYRENQKVIYQINKNNFNDKFRDCFNNLSLLLSISDLGTNQIIEISKYIIYVLRSTNIYFGHNINALKLFIKGNKSKLANDFYINLLTVLCDKPKYFTSEVLYTMGSIFVDLPTENKLTDSLLLQRIIDLLEDDTHPYFNKTYRYFEDLWYIFHSDLQKVIQKRIVDNLQKEFSTKIYWYYVMQDYLGYDLFFDAYICHVAESISADIAPYRREYVLMSNEYASAEVFSYDFINFIRMVYKLDLFSKIDKIMRLDISKDYMLFYLSPQTFDYDKFEVDWLTFTLDSNVHNKLSSITQVKSSLIDYVRKERHNKKLNDLLLKYYL